jgi:hypothetical protein
LGSKSSFHHYGVGVIHHPFWDQYTLLMTTHFLDNT